MQIERTKGIHPSYLCRDLYLYPLIYGLCNIIYIYTFYPGALTWNVLVVLNDGGHLLLAGGLIRIFFLQLYTTKK